MKVESMSTRDTILALFEEVARDSKVELAPLEDGLPLTKSGLDSLLFAIIVARLEDILGIDPFTDVEQNRFPVTFGDFVAMYENAAR